MCREACGNNGGIEDGEEVASQACAERERGGVKGSLADRDMLAEQIREGRKTDRSGCKKAASCYG